MAEKIEYLEFKINHSGIFLSGVASEEQFFEFLDNFYQKVNEAKKKSITPRKK